MAKKLMLFAAMFAAMGSFATDYFVDAVNGNDDWDGSSSNHVSGTVGPKRTIQAMMDKVPGGFGHTVYALPGRYDAGLYAAQTARTQVKGSTRLVSTGGKDVTFIVGSHTNGAPESCDVGADVTRCVFMCDGAVLQGFTLTGGRAIQVKGEERNNGGVYFHASSATADPAYVVDCTITDCYAARGGASYGNWSNPNLCRFVNCLFTGNKGLSPSSCIGKCYAWNCVFANTLSGSSYVNLCKLWNCTVYQSIVSTEAWNTAMPDAQDGGSSTFHRCVTYDSKKDSSTWDDGTKQIAASEMQFDGNYRPISGANKGIDAANDQAYLDSIDTYFDESKHFVADIKQWLLKDLSGGPRKVGAAMDIGAGEFSLLSVPGLTVTVTDLGDGTSRLTIGQDATSDRYVSGFTYGDETVSFDVHARGWTWSKVVAGDPLATAFASVSAKTGDIYVDPVFGDDGDTGVGRFHAVKTLPKAMAKVSSGCTIRALPGVYRYTENCAIDNYGSSNVVYFSKANVTLLGVKGAKETVIEGNPVNRPDGVRCVFANQSGSVVRGFTLRNGGTAVEDNVKGHGAGIYTGTAVDCIITGCRAGGRGGAAYGSELVRCYLEDCTIRNGSGTAMENGNMYGCVVKGLVHYGWSGYKDVNCTYFGGGYPAGNSANSEIYNTLVVGNSGGKCNYHNCVLTGAKAASDTDENTLFGQAAAEYAYNPDTFRPADGSKLIDAGDNDLYETKFAAAYRGDYVDVGGTDRIVGGTIDLGAGEYFPGEGLCSACTKVLSRDGRAVVTAATGGVRTTGAGVAVPAGASATVVWSTPPDTQAELTFRYTVRLADGATLRISEFGETVREITEPGEHSFVSSVDHELVFAAIGGEVVLSDFFNVSALSVVDANGRLAVAGATSGVTPVLPGAPALTATFSRTDFAQPQLTGVRVNGEFRPFAGETGDVPQSVTVTDASGWVTVEAVYERVWYVDAEKGDDSANDGTAPYKAKKTLIAAMALTTANKGDVVHAAPGVYSNGIIRTFGSTTNRVEVNYGTGLVADRGPAVTVIEGAWSRVPEAVNGCGPDAVRCVALKSNAWVQGFTLRNGATVVTSQYADCGGGVSGADETGTTLDCIIENCRAQRGGACSHGTYIRCLTRGNGSADISYSKLGVYDVKECYGCVVTDGQMYGNISKVVNCSLVGTTLNGNSTWPHVYNSYVYYDNGSSHYHNCVVGGRYDGSQSTYDDCVRVPQSGVLLDVDGAAPTYRPLASAEVLIDKGDWNAYVTNWPAKWSCDTDLCGGARVLNAGIDIGAGEFDWTTARNSGLTVAVADLGQNAYRLSVSQAFDSPKLCLGFTYDGETVLFAEHGAGYVWTKVTDGNPLVKVLAPIYATADEWYVDGTNGDDGNPGYWTNVAFKTIAKALGVVKSGGIVHVLPGVYADAPMGRIGGYLTSNRVIVPNGVGVVADFGPDVTAIEGDISGEAGWTNSVRCVYLYPNAWIRGFTLRNGAAVRTGDYGECGGGVSSAERNRGTAIDCVIRDCKAVRGGGAHYTDTVRCRFAGNSTDSGSAYYGHHVDSFFDEGQNLYTDGTVLNCTVRGSLWSMDATLRTKAYNSLVSSDGSRVDYHNCYLYDRWLYSTTQEATSTLDEDSRLGETAAFVFDADGRPASGSTAIDAGKDAYYPAMCPERLQPFLNDLDFAGGNRIWGGTIDLGAGEYDWRPAFGKRLGSRVRVTEAGPNVAVDENTVRIPAGEKITGVWTMKYDTTYYFTVTADTAATVVVKLDGETLTPDADGRFAVDGTVGDHAFEIAVTGEGAARAGGFRADRGSVLILR